MKKEISKQICEPCKYCDAIKCNQCDNTFNGFSIIMHDTKIRVTALDECINEAIIVMEELKK